MSAPAKRPRNPDQAICGEEPSGNGDGISAERAALDAKRPVQGFTLDGGAALASRPADPLASGARGDYPPTTSRLASTLDGGAAVASRPDDPPTRGARGDYLPTPALAHKTASPAPTWGRGAGGRGGDAHHPRQARDPQERGAAAQRAAALSGGRRQGKIVHFSTAVGGDGAQGPRAPMKTHFDSR